MHRRPDIMNDETSIMVRVQRRLSKKPFVEGGGVVGDMGWLQCGILSFSRTKSATPPLVLDCAQPLRLIIEKPALVSSP